MARIRSVHPGIYTDEAWASVPPETRWLGIGLATEADDAGVFEWKPLQIKMRIFPADNVDISAMLSALAGAGIVLAFDVGGKKYGAIHNFCRYQRPRKPKQVHPITDEARVFVALGSEPCGDDEVEVPKKSVPDAVGIVSVPQKSENGPQMDDVVGRMESSSLRSEETAAVRRDAIAEAMSAIDCQDDPNLILTGSRVLAWLDQGADLDLDVLPTLSAVTSRKRKRDGPQWVPRSMSFFDNAIADAIARRTKPLPEGKPDVQQPRNRHTYDPAEARRATLAVFPELMGGGDGGTA